MPAPAPILFYDAGCWLCRIVKDWLADAGGSRLLFADARNRPLAAALGVHDLARLDTQACLLLPSGQAFWGYEAFVELLLQSGTSGTAGIVRLLQLPSVRRIGAKVYNWVSRNRRWISA